MKANSFDCKIWKQNYWKASEKLKRKNNIRFKMLIQDNNDLIDTDDIKDMFPEPFLYDWVLFQIGDKCTA